MVFNKIDSFILLSSHELFANCRLNKSEFMSLYEKIDKRTMKNRENGAKISITALF